MPGKGVTKLSWWEIKLIKQNGNKEIVQIFKEAIRNPNFMQIFMAFHR